ncbi:MAG: hypothetical protein HY721_08520 [Planctomycetes bacterium]|nr:hypothetical protein [Planctomycetota bacterium]
MTTQEARPISASMRASIATVLLLAVGPSSALAAPWPLWRERKASFQLVLPAGDERGARLVRSTLERHLRDLFGVALRPSDGAREPGTRIVAGAPATSSEIARLAAAGLKLTTEDLGDEGFELLTHEAEGRRHVVLHGRTPRALKHACQELLFFRVSAGPAGGDLEAPITAVRRPEVRYRGVYMLPCWSAHDSLESWRRVLLFNSELTLNRSWFWLDGFPVAGHTGEYAGTALARAEAVQGLIDLANGEDMKLLIGGGWFNWHHEKAVGKELAKGRDYYLQYLKAFRGFHGFYIEPTGEGSEVASWRGECEMLRELVRTVLGERPDLELAIAIGKFNNPEYLKLMAELDPKRVFWWWCWGDPIAQKALDLYPSVLRWHLSARMSEYHGSMDPPGPRDEPLAGIATSYDPGQGFGNPWNGWGKLGVDRPRDFHPHTVPYFAQQYHFRERSWDLRFSEEAFLARLQRRLFDAGAPGEAARRYWAVSRMAQAALEKRRPAKAELAEARALVEALRVGPSTPRQADTVARMEEAVRELEKLGADEKLKGKP